MIGELDRYHGVVLRQLLVAIGRSVRIGVADVAGRVDVFHVEGAAFQLKHSAKRLSPWQFTYAAENFAELAALQDLFSPVWAFLICGQDGVVGLSMAELMSIAAVGEGGSAWLRVSRSRNSMYRVSGALGDLARAKPRGVHDFVAAMLGSTSVL